MSPIRSRTHHHRPLEEQTPAPVSELDAEVSADSLRVLVEQRGHRSWAMRAAGEIDVATAPELREAIRGVLEEEPQRLVIDLDSVTFLDSTGLGVLVWAYQRMSGRPDGLILVCHSAACMRVIEITGLGRVFSFAASVGEALTGPDQDSTREASRRDSRPESSARLR